MQSDQSSGLTVIQCVEARHAQRRPVARRGFALIWVALLLVSLLGFAGMAIDVGRLRLAGSELQAAADGAARAAAWPIPTQDYTEVEDRAVAVASANKVDAEAVSLTTDKDLEFGVWFKSTKTFMPVTGDDRQGANAVRIHARRVAARSSQIDYFFAPMVGVNSADVTRSAIAYIAGGWKERGGKGFGLVGLDWVQFNGVSATDSYDPTKGAYNALVNGTANKNENGTIATNGTINMVGTAQIHGDARSGPDEADWEDSSFGSNTTVTGWTAPLDQNLDYPIPAAPTTYNNSAIADYIDSKGNLSVNGKATLTLPAGTYVVKDIDLKANQTINVSGAVKIYATGSVTVLGGVVTNGVVNSTGLPSDMQIFAVGTVASPAGQVNIGGNSSISAWIYAPGRDVVLHGTSGTFGLFGAVVGKTLDILGNSALHYDESASFGTLPPELDKFWVELVQ